MSAGYSIGLMNQLGDALEKAGFTVGDVTKLRTFKDLVGVKDVVCGRANIAQIEHIINCDAKPFVPKGWRLRSHKKMGQLEWNPEKIYLRWTTRPEAPNIIVTSFLEELQDEGALNANVLDYLIAHPELMPKDWSIGRGSEVLFWGTTYFDEEGNRVVRYLRGCGSDKPDWCYGRFGDDWRINPPTAYLKK